MKTEQGTIHERLVKIMGEVEAVGKNQENERQNFKFRGIDDILNSLHTIFKKHGVFTSPEVLEYKVDYMPHIDKKTGNAVGQWTSVLIKLRINFKAADGSTTCSEALGHGMDTGDKAASKAMSMAVKYALINTFLIPTAEDKDGDAHNPTPSYSRQYNTIPKTVADKRQSEVMAKHGAVDDEPPFNEDEDLPIEKSWRNFKIPFGKQKGVALGNLDSNSLSWWQTTWKPEEKVIGGKLYPISEEALALRSALDASMEGDDIPF